MHSLFATFPCGRFFGVPVRVQYLLVAFVSFTAWLSNNPAYSLAVWGVVLASIVLHEYGHILAGRTQGLAAEKVLLTPIGGIATLSGVKGRTPWGTFWVAAAGPLVTACIAFGSLFIPSAAKGFGEIVFFVNVVLLVFNLLPIYPMDGGRMLAALAELVAGKRQYMGPVLGVGFVTAVVTASFFFTHSMYMAGVLVITASCFGLMEAKALNMLAGYGGKTRRYRLSNASRTKVYTVQADRMGAGFDIEEFQRSISMAEKEVFSCQRIE